MKFIDENGIVKKNIVFKSPNDVCLFCYGGKSINGREALETWDETEKCIKTLKELEVEKVLILDKEKTADE